MNDPYPCCPVLPQETPALWKVPGFSQLLPIEVSGVSALPIDFLVSLLVKMWVVVVASFRRCVLKLP